MRRILTAMVMVNHWYAGTADDARALYRRAFRDVEVLAHVRYPESGLPDFMAPLAGTTMQYEIAVHGSRLGMVNGDGTYAPSPAISQLVNFDPSVLPDAREYLDAAWEVLADGGNIRMPLGEYSHSPHYGWVEDRFGVGWQLMLTNPDGDPAPFITPDVLFTEPVLWRAGEALDAWVAAVPGSEVLHRVTYPPREDVPAGAIMFADAAVGGAPISVMDSGPGHELPFTPGSSFVVRCPDQATIDKVWDALSADPEAEACGWLKDRFGISWQVLPENMGELMRRPGAHEHMMAMRKVIIDEL